MNWKHFFLDVYKIRNFFQVFIFYFQLSLQESVESDQQLGIECGWIEALSVDMVIQSWGNKCFSFMRETRQIGKKVMIYTQIGWYLFKDFGGFFLGNFCISLAHLGFSVITVVNRGLLEWLKPLILGLWLDLFFEVLSAGMKLFKLGLVFILTELNGIIHITKIDFIHEEILFKILHHVFHV